MKLTRRKVLIGVVVAVPLLLLGGCVLLSIDEPPPDDSDLAVTRSVVPEEENGFRFVKDLEEPEPVVATDEDGEEETLDPGTPFTEGWNPKVAQEYLDKNPELLECLEKVLSAPRFQVPELAHIGESQEFVFRLRDLAYAVGYRAGLRWKAGVEEDAWRDALALVHLARRMQGGEGEVLVCLIGVSVESTGVRLLRELVLRTKSPDGEVLQLLSELGSRSIEDAGFSLAFKAGHQLLCKMIERMHSGEEFDAQWDDRTMKLWNRLSFTRGLALKPNKSRLLSAQYFRQLVAYRAPWKDKAQPLGPCGELPHVEFTWWPPDNLAGKAILGVMLPTYVACLDVLGQLHAERSTPAVLFALRRYERDRGGLPEKLDDLVPKYLERVPIDPFDARPLKYSREKRVIYSIGPGGQNADGTKEDHSWAIEAPGGK